MLLQRLILYCLCSLPPIWLAAQASFGKWFAPPSGTNIAFTAVVPTSDGGWLAAGEERGAGAAFFTRFQSDGSIAWSRQATQIRQLRDVLAFPDGTFLALNNNRSFNEYFDASMLYLSADGAVLADKVWGTPGGQDEWYAGMVMASGDAICVGIQREYDNLPFIQGLSLARVSPGFELSWSRTWQAPGLYTPTDVAEAVDGFFVAGELLEDFQSKLTLLRFDGDGNLLLTRTFELDGGLQGSTGVVGLPDGGALLCGYNFGAPNAAGLILRLDAAGELVWAKALASGGEFSTSRLYLKDDNTAILVGLNNTQTFPPVDNNLVVHQLAIADGSILSSLSFGSVQSDLVFDGYWDGELLTLAGESLAGTSNQISSALLFRTRLENSCCERDFSFQIADITSELQVGIPNWMPIAALAPQDNPASTSAYPLEEEIFCQSGGEGKSQFVNICLGEAVLLTADTLPGTIYAWSTGAMTPGIVIDAPGLYFVTLTDECGTRTDTFAVMAVGNAVQAVVNPPEAILCSGQSIRLQASGGTAYSWSPTDGLSLTDVANPIASPLATTAYQLVVSDGACADTLAVTITVNPAPQAEAGPDTLLLRPMPVQLSASGGETYQWSPARGLDCTDCPAPLALPEQTTLYTVTVFDPNGCAAAAEVLVEVDFGRCAAYIPNAFSPNDDGRNDTFQVYARPDQFSIRIFDRWGNEVYRAEDISQPWDGRFRGKLAPAGVYVYLVEMELCGQPEVFSGDVLLVR
jgi:gliding motility-associated-like protein